MSSLTIVSLSAIVIYIAYRLVLQTRSKLPLPPGPSNLPLIGNLLDMPKRSDVAWEVYENWCKLYNSDVIHLKVFGTSILVVNTLEAATELLEKRSSIYSDRPRFTMLNELMGWDFNFAFMPYGDKWRARRTLFHQEFNQTSVQRQQPRLRENTHDLLRRLLDDPENFTTHIRHMAGSNILSMVYGIDNLPPNNPHTVVAEAALDALTRGVLPGTFWVDSMSFLRHVPHWFPGAGFKRQARVWYGLARTFCDMPFETGKQNHEKAQGTESFMSSCFRNKDELEESDIQELEKVFKSTAATMHAAAIDTTYAALCTFILAMLSNPEAQKQAQAEIDSILQFGELPHFSDKESMPMVDAILMEVLRWKTVAPLGIPHRLTQDDVYHGYRIPEGTQILANIWAMVHDETIYPEPHSFKPERFIKDGKLNPDVRDPCAAVFGFGRRSCPGLAMGYSTLWIAMSSILAMFEIRKAVDEHGDIIEPSYEYTSTLAYIPLPFDCSIRPRGARGEALIQIIGSAGGSASVT
ncbi:cytochrome P450 [Mycena floridula]|nr:cytochrome P450 [Mycena floridula]